MRQKKAAAVKRPARFRSPLKWPGGKSYLAPSIVALFPPHKHYVETHFGGGAVMFAADPQGRSEVANDRDRWLTNFWRAIQDPKRRALLIERLSCCPFSEVEWLEASLFHDMNPKACFGKADQADWAAYHFFVLVRQSLAGRTDSFAPLSKTRTRQGANEQAAAWWGAVDRLEDVAKRLERVVITSTDAVKLIPREDSKDTLFYLDPPYLIEGKALNGVYAVDADMAHHEALLAALSGIKGKFLLSGYRSDLYDEHAKFNGWNRHDFKIDNKAAHGKTKRVMTECIWSNF